MVTIVIKYRVRPTREAEFMQAILWSLHSLDDFEAHRGSRLLQDEEDALQYRLVSEWEDHEGLDAVLASKAFHELGEWREQELLSRPPRHLTLVDFPAGSDQGEP